MTNLRRSCPSCKTILDTSAISSEKNYRACHTDFFQRFAGFQPILRGALSCTTCGYADFTGNFPYIFSAIPEGTNIDEDGIEELMVEGEAETGREAISPIPFAVRRFTERNLLPIQEAIAGRERFAPHEYERMALISEFRQDPPELTGLFYLFSAWSCRCLDKEKLEPWYDELYAKWFERACNATQAQGVRPAFHSYLAAEGYRRSSDTTRAARYYERSMRFLEGQHDYDWFLETISRQAKYPAEFLEDTLKTPMNTLFLEMTGKTGGNFTSGI